MMRAASAETEPNGKATAHYTGCRAQSLDKAQVTLAVSDASAVAPDDPLLLGLLRGSMIAAVHHERRKLPRLYDAPLRSSLAVLLCLPPTPSQSSCAVKSSAPRR